MQGSFHTVNDQRVASVVATLEPHHALGAFGQPIHQLALALITPLGAHDDDITAFN